MKKQTFLIVGGVILVGVGGYFGYKAYQKNKANKSGATTPKGGTPTPRGDGTSGSGSAIPKMTSAEFDKVSYWKNDDRDNDFLLSDGMGGSVDVPANTFLSAVDYLKRYPDVANEWGQTSGSPYSHFLRFGKAEGRKWNVIPSVSFFQANTTKAASDYLKRYPDVAQGFDGTPYLHFWAFGVKEGRNWNYNL